MEHYSEQARLISICDYLGIVADKKEVWIKSPFNPSERTASFKIHVPRNIWYDHAIGKGGSVIDLVMLLNNCNFTKALSILSLGKYQPRLNQNFKQNSNEPKKEIAINKIKDLQNKALVRYLKKRKININIARKYLKEIYYKDYFALAFQNDSGDYELRNSYFKGCIGHKDITTIKGKGNRELSVFEGFIDFLSALTYYRTFKFKSDVIILNSVVNKLKVATTEYKKIYLFLDNDKAGTDTKEYFKEINSNCIDCSNIYKNHKDFNDFLLYKYSSTTRTISKYIN